MRPLQIRLGQDAQVIAAGGLQVLVAKDLPDIADGAPVAQEIRRKRMTHDMGRDALRGTDHPGVPPEHLLCPVLGQALSAFPCKKGWSRILSHLEVHL